MSAGLAPERAPPASGAAARRVRAWDLPTRLFKWGLVILVVNAFLTQARGSAGIKWHIWNGYAVLTLLVFRLLWGLFGSSTARFSAWVTWPWTALIHAGKVVRGRGGRYLGHNPLGGWMILTLLGLAFAQGLTGLFTVDNNGLEGGPFANLDFGDPTPLQRALMFWHFRGFYVLLGFAVVHILVNLWYQTAKMDPVITGMVVGRKPAADYVDQPEMRPAPATPLRALLCLAAAAGIVLGGVALAGGKLPF